MRIPLRNPWREMAVVKRDGEINRLVPWADEKKKKEEDGR
jgi:hypothetical protein